MDLFYKRRSIREYTDKIISDDKINELIKVGMNAPSAYNTKPIEYLVVSDRDKLIYLSEVHKYGKMLKNASHAIIVCAKETSPFWVQDAAAATENILLAATNLGIGSCWIGLYPNDNESVVKEYFNIPNDVRAFSTISLGYPLKEKTANNFYEEKRIHHNEWR